MGDGAGNGRREGAVAVEVRGQVVDPQQGVGRDGDQDVGLATPR